MLSTLRIDNSPFSEQQLKQLQASIGGLSPVQSQWLSGFLAGHLSESLQKAVTVNTPPGNSAVLSIIYATETGHSETVAIELAESLQNRGISTELHSLDSFRPAALKKLKDVAFVISTHGEGEPPDEALAFFEYLEGDHAPRLDELNYRILALGDQSYQLFCEAGRRLDERLQVLGARSFGRRLECDVDYTSEAQVYANELFHFARENLIDTPAKQPETPSGQHLSLVTSDSNWSRQQPFSAELTQTQKITGTDSNKDVHHLELSLEGSGIRYQPGDALGVWADNDPMVIDQLLQMTQIDPSAPVIVQDQSLNIGEALSQHLEITRLTTTVVREYAQLAGQEELEASFAASEAAQQQVFVEQRQFVDLVEQYPARLNPQALVDILRPLAPRSYSIASSQQAVDEEVHLTVATYRSNAIGNTRVGVASGLLNQRLITGEKIRVYLEANRRFRLPEDQQAPIIMIAAGTGIAPYRAFMQELEARPGHPQSWLIFGNPHLRSDFLYQREWLRWRETGLLNRIDTAWSQDQSEKHYVQDVVREQARTIDDWLTRGAHIYLCGSKLMGQAVQSALQDVLIQQRGTDATGAAQVLADLRRKKRLKKDLY